MFKKKSNEKKKYKNYYYFYLDFKILKNNLLFFCLKIQIPAKKSKKTKKIKNFFFINKKLIIFN